MGRLGDRAIAFLGDRDCLANIRAMYFLTMQGAVAAPASHRAYRSAWVRLIAWLYETDPQGGALRRLLKIGRAPPGFDPSTLN